MTKKRIGTTSYKDTAFGIIPRSELIPLEIEGTRRVWEYVLNAQKKHPITVTPAFIRKLHQIGFAFIFPSTGGRFRSVEVAVSDHIPPPYYEVPALMLEYCRDLKVRLKHLPAQHSNTFVEELLSLLAWMHHRFLWVHPFHDYNGRISRILLNVTLLNLDLPPIELRVETMQGRKRYVESLRRADKGDFILLEKLIRDAITETLSEV